MRKYGYKFAYKGYTFIGENKFNKKFNFNKVMKLLHVSDLDIVKSSYDHEDFYSAFNKMNYEFTKEEFPDIFRCLETDKLYIPGNENILIIKRLDKIERMLIG